MQRRSLTAAEGHDKPTGVITKALTSKNRRTEKFSEEDMRWRGIRDNTQRTDSYINKNMRGREQSCRRGERKQKRRSTDTKKTRQGEVKERERAGELTGQKKSRTARPRKGPMNAGKRTNKEAFSSPSSHNR